MVHFNNDSSILILVCKNACQAMRIILVSIGIYSLPTVKIHFMNFTTQYNNDAIGQSALNNNVMMLHPK